MKKVLIIFGFILYSNLGFAQIDIYGVPPNRSHLSFIPAINRTKTQAGFKNNNILFFQNRPLLSQYLPRKQDCFFLLSSQTSICFNREINMEAMSRQTKLLFFKMKMWGYFH